MSGVFDRFADTVASAIALPQPLNLNERPGEQDHVGYVEVSDQDPILNPEPEPEQQEELICQQLIECFIHDLNSKPKADKTDDLKIDNLHPGFRATRLKKLSTDCFTGIFKYTGLTGGKYGRNLCSIHSKIQSYLLFDLFELIREETKRHDTKFCDPRLNNKYLRALMEINTIWEPMFFEKNNVILIRNCDMHFNQYLEQGYFQKNNCAGCCIRRVLSDPRCVGALLAAVDFRVQYDRIKRDDIPEVYRYLKTAWRVLSTGRPDLWYHAGDPSIIRANIKARVKKLVDQLREHESHNYQ